MVSTSIFFEDELLAWIEGGKKKTVAEINEEAKAFISEKHSDSSLFITICIMEKERTEGRVKQSKNERIEQFLKEHYAFRFNTVKSRTEFENKILILHFVLLLNMILTLCVGW